MSLPITHSKHYDVQTRNYFRRQDKRFLRGKIWPEQLLKSKMVVLACGSSPEKRFRLDENSSLRSSLHQYINNQQPKTTTVSSVDIHAHPRAVIPSFGSIRGHVTGKFCVSCLAAKNWNFERALDNFLAHRSL